MKTKKTGKVKIKKGFEDFKVFGGRRKSWGKQKMRKMLITGKKIQ